MSETKKYLRFPIAQRIEHWILFASFTTLGLTGLVQKFSQYGVSQWGIEVLGGIESVRVLHRVAAIVMMFQTVYHLVLIGYRIFVRRDRMSILPELRDVRVALEMFLYNLGLRADHPKQGHYTVEEKAEYWALVWGTIVMGLTGFMLWNPILTARLFPGEFIPAAKAAHGGEALLAVLAIIVWHGYHVHLKFFNKSMFDGHLTEEQMLDEHPLELAEIKANAVQRPARRQVPRWESKFFIPSNVAAPPLTSQQRITYSVVSGLVVLVMLAGIYFFISYEDSAITTVPPIERVEVFAPLTATPLPTPVPSPTPRPTSTPLPTPAPDAKLTWQDGPADILAQKCGACHNDAARLGDLDLGSYQAALEGGVSGPVIEPGDPSASSLVTLIEAGEHPGQLDDSELERLRQWIADGALEE